MKWTIKNKIVATCVAAVLVTALMALISGLYMRGVQDSQERARVATEAIRNQFDADMAHDAIRADVLSILVQKDRRDRASHRAELTEHVQVLRGGVERNRRGSLSKAALERLANVQPVVESYARAANALADRGISDPESATKGLPDFQKTFAELEGSMSAISDVLEADAKRAKEDAGASLARMNLLQKAIGWVAIAVGVTFLYFLGKSILDPLKALAGNLRGIAEGNLVDARMDETRSDELGEVVHWFNKTIEAQQTSFGEQQKRDAEFRSQIQAIQRSLAVVELGLDGTILHANEKFLGLFGYSLDEVVGRHHRMLVSDAERNSPKYGEFWMGLGRGQFQSGEFQRVTKNGRTIWVQGIYNPLFDADGRPVKILKFALDITERKIDALNDIRQLDEINRTSVLNILDPEGNTLEVNENYTRLFGYSAQEIQGRHFATVIDPEDPANADAPRLWRQVIEGGFARTELRARTRDGKQVWIDVACTPIFDAAGKVVRVKAVSTDITRRKRSEASLTDTLAMVARSAEDLAQASEELNQISMTMGATSEETAVQAAAVAGASEQVHRGVSAVADGAEETSITIREVAHSAADAAMVATQAVSVADGVNQTVAKLGRSSQEIDQVIKVITGIAEQTNLLALNATIEAARAGGAGKGFAVVANEVKELAKETSQATEDIGRKIATIQQDTAAAVDAIGEISEIIRQIHGFQNTIASAVEEQSATMSEIGRTIDSAALGAREITSNLSGVAESAQATAAGATQTQAAAGRLAEMASGLKALTQELGGDEGDRKPNFQTAPNPSHSEAGLVGGRSCSAPRGWRPAPAAWRAAWHAAGRTRSGRRARRARAGSGRAPLGMLISTTPPSGMACSWRRSSSVCAPACQACTARPLS